MKELEQTVATLTEKVEQDVQKIITQIHKRL